MDQIKVLFYKIKLKFLIFKNLKKIVDEKYYSQSFLFSKTLHFFLFGSKNNFRPNKNFNLRLFKLNNNIYHNNQFLSLNISNNVSYKKLIYKKVIFNIRERKKLFYKNGKPFNKILKKKNKNFIIIGSGNFDYKLLKQKSFKNYKIITINEVGNYFRSDYTIAKDTPLTLKTRGRIILSKYLNGDEESKLLNFCVKKFFYFNQLSKINLSLKDQLLLLDKNQKYLINSSNTYLNALHFACLMGAKSVVTFGITKDFKHYIKNYYKNKKNLVPDRSKKIYLYFANKERNIVEKYLIKKFKIKLANNIS